MAACASHAELAPLGAIADSAIKNHENQWPQVHVLPSDDNLQHIQTVLHDATVSASDYRFCADRLIRLVVEAGLNLLATTAAMVETPGGSSYEGLAFGKGVCAVTIMHSGQAMERGLRECCKSIRVGHLLIQHDRESQRPQVYYAKFAPDIAQRTILLLDPVINTGETVVTALDELKASQADLHRVIVLSLFAQPHGLDHILGAYPQVQIVCSEVHELCCSQDFSKLYFGV